MTASMEMLPQRDPEPFLNVIKLAIKINHHRKDVQGSTTKCSRAHTLGNLPQSHDRGSKGLLSQYFLYRWTSPWTSIAIFTI